MVFPGAVKDASDPVSIQPPGSGVPRGQAFAYTLLPQTLTLTVYQVLLGTHAIDVLLATGVNVVWLQAAPAGVTLSKKSALELFAAQVSVI